MVITTLQRIFVITCYFYATYCYSFSARSMSRLDKSFRSNDPIQKYCNEVSLEQDPLLEEISKKTLQYLRHGGMIGAPEVHQLGQNLIRLIQGKKALDIGTLTGASAVAWALALPPDGEVVTMDVSHDALKNVSEQLIQSREDVAKKIQFKLGPALETLDSLLTAGGAGQWDFAFIDADKENYLNYYEKCVKLLRPGGVILIDNALWHGKVLDEQKDAATTAIDRTNRRAHEDERVDNTLLQMADGVHLIFKKHTI